MAGLTSEYNSEDIPNKTLWSFMWKFSFIGAIAGIAAVNLLNPSGNISQVMILGLIAGLSGVSYLKRVALVEDIYEKISFRLLKQLQNTTNSILSNQEIEIDIEKDTVLDEDNINQYSTITEVLLDEWLNENPNVTEEQSNLFIEALSSALAEELSKYPDSTIEEIKEYLNDFKHNYSISD